MIINHIYDIIMFHLNGGIHRYIWAMLVHCLTIVLINDNSSPYYLVYKINEKETEKEREREMKYNRVNEVEGLYSYRFYLEKPVT